MTVARVILLRKKLDCFVPRNDGSKDEHPNGASLRALLFGEAIWIVASKIYSAS